MTKACRQRAKHSTLKLHSWHRCKRLYLALFKPAFLCRELVNAVTGGRNFSYGRASRQSEKLFSQPVHTVQTTCLCKCRQECRQFCQVSTLIKLLAIKLLCVDSVGCRQFDEIKIVGAKSFVFLDKVVYTFITQIFSALQVFQCFGFVFEFAVCHTYNFITVGIVAPLCQHLLCCVNGTLVFTHVEQQCGFVNLVGEWLLRNGYGRV